MTAENPASILTTRMATLVERLPEVRILQLNLMKYTALLALLNDVKKAYDFPYPDPPPPIANHKGICIPFEVDGLKLEAVGFLKEGEKRCTAKEALRRCDNGGLLTTAEHYHAVWGCGPAEFPTELRGYEFLTMVPYDVRMFVCFGTSWDGFCDYRIALNKRCDRSYLVLRCRAS